MRVGANSVVGEAGGCSATAREELNRVAQNFFPFGFSCTRLWQQTALEFILLQLRPVPQHACCNFIFKAQPALSNLRFNTRVFCAGCYDVGRHC